MVIDTVCLGMTANTQTHTKLLSDSLCRTSHLLRRSVDGQSSEWIPGFCKFRQGVNLVEKRSSWCRRETGDAAPSCSRPARSTTVMRTSRQALWGLFEGFAPLRTSECSNLHSAGMHSDTLWSGISLWMIHRTIRKYFVDVHISLFFGLNIPLILILMFREWPYDPWHFFSWPTTLDWLIEAKTNPQRKSGNRLLKIHYQLHSCDRSSSSGIHTFRTLTRLFTLSDFGRLLFFIMSYNNKFEKFDT